MSDESRFLKIEERLDKLESIVSSSRGKEKNGQQNAFPEQSPSRVNQVISAKVISEEYPALFSKQKDSNAELKALSVIKFAKDSCSIDGLDCSEISQILKEKFRLSIDKMAVKMALLRSGGKTDRVKIKKAKAFAYIYKIMAEGETALNAFKSPNK